MTTNELLKFLVTFLKDNIISLKTCCSRHKSTWPSPGTEWLQHLQRWAAEARGQRSAERPLLASTGSSAPGARPQASEQSPRADRTPQELAAVPTEMSTCAQRGKYFFWGSWAGPQTCGCTNQFGFLLFNFLKDRATSPCRFLKIACLYPLEKQNRAPGAHGQVWL